MAESGKTKIVAITGGIASGKSTVGKMVAARGYFVIDTDRIAHEITSPGSDAVREIADAFGEDVLKPDGSLDRRKTADIVFSDPGKLEKLESILHPKIQAEWHRRVDESEKKWAFVVIPLLFEAGIEGTVDRIWLCFSPAEIRLERAMRRDDASEERILARMNAQIPDEEKTPRSDVVLDTAASFDETDRQVADALAELEGSDC